MRNIAIRDVEIEFLKTSPGFMERLMDDRVIEIARSIQLHGMQTYACVRGYDNRVAFGEERIAAAWTIGMKICKVRIVDCSDEELEILRLVDIKETRARGITALLDFHEAEIEAERAKDSSWRYGKGRPATARGEARRRVSRDLGMTYESVARYDNSDRNGPPGDAKARKQKARWRLDTYGFECDPIVLERAYEAREALSSAEQLLRRAQGAMTPVMDGESVPAFRGQAIHQRTKEASALARQAMPSHMCPYCKAIASIRGSCNACHTTGYVSKHDFESADETLRTMRIVAHAGQYLDMDTMRVPVVTKQEMVASFVDEEAFECDEEPPLEVELPVYPEDFSEAEF